MITKTRDILGLESIYYRKSGRKVIFAPELKQILALDGFKPEIDKEALRYYLSCGYCPDNRTLLKGVSKILSAETVKYNGSIIKCSKYWWPSPCERTPLDMKHWEISTWMKLKEVVESQLPPDEGKVGIALSGGLDSALVATMLRHVKKDMEIIGYSLDYGSGAESELEMAEKLAKCLDIDFRVVKMNIYISDLEQLQRIYDEPLIKFTFIPTYYLAKEARKEVKTLFTGDGGDELFIGYRNDYWEDPALIKVFSKLGILRKPALKMCGALCNPMANLTKSQIFSLASEFFGREDASSPYWQYRVASRIFQPYCSDEDVWGLLGNNHYRISYSIGDSINNQDWRATNIEKLSHAMIGSRLPNDLLRLEKAASATGLKIKSPFLDSSMVKFALSIPIQLRYQQGTTKYLLRQMIKDYSLLPQEVADNKSKAGMTAPIHKWLTDKSSRDYFDDLLNYAGILGLNKDYIRKFYPPKTYTQTLKAWNVMGLLLWVKTFGVGGERR